MSEFDPTRKCTDLGLHRFVRCGGGRGENVAMHTHESIVDLVLPRTDVCFVINGWSPRRPPGPKKS